MSKNKNPFTFLMKTNFKSLPLFIVCLVILLIASLVVVLRVQKRTVQREIYHQGIKQILQINSAGTDNIKNKSVKKFFKLKAHNKYNDKLYNFEFIVGFDRSNPNQEFKGQLQGKKYSSLHDLAAQALAEKKAVMQLNRGNPPHTVISLPLEDNQVGIVVKNITTRTAPTPWLGIILIIMLAVAAFFLTPEPWKIIVTNSIGALGFGMLASGYRLAPHGSLLEILGNSPVGFTRGIFPPIWLITSLFFIGTGILYQRGKIDKLITTIKSNRIAYTYVLPAMLGMGLLVLLPFAIGLGLGFFNHCNGEFQFIGIDNFVDILSGGGTSLGNPLNFYFTLGVTLLWTLLNVFLHVSIGLSLALILKDPLLKMKSVYRVLLIIPWAMPNYITALMWKGMFQQQYGAINIILDNIGIGGISWFSTFWPAFMANVITNTWLGFPFMMVVSLGALQSIPSSLYEAAEVDGASKWQQFRNITLPLLRPALFPAIVLGSIWTFNMFNIIYLVSGGEPGGSTDILITEAYQWAFKRGERYGLAAAYAILIFVVLIIYTRITNKLTKAAEDM
ncbi:MAG: sugar ABC transporter permease [Deltaproteobacteria bacterium]|jgi:ABC-type sugar transport system permease subunit|nr:sugar ABC transporter permease [Deltaproteobacteria bacterium]